MYSSQSAPYLSGTRRVSMVKRVGGDPRGDSLFFAKCVVPSLPVNEEDSEVDDVKVGERGIESSRETPGESHNKITEIIRMPRHTPPSTRQKFCAALCLHKTEVLRILAVPEIVLLAIGASEDVIP